jgi:hypothetical protein
MFYSVLHCIVLHCMHSCCNIKKNGKYLVNCKVCTAREEKIQCKSRYPSTQVHTALTLLLLQLACRLWDINQLFSSGIFFVLQPQPKWWFVHSKRRTKWQSSQPRFSQNLAINLLTYKYEVYSKLYNHSFIFLATDWKKIKIEIWQILISFPHFWLIIFSEENLPLDDHKKGNKGFFFNIFLNFYIF